MGKRLYVGNLSYGTTEDALMQAFAAWGATSVTLPTDEGGRPKGFGFVEIPEDDQASLAVDAMNGKELDGRQLTVNEARPRVERGGGGGSRGGRGGYGGGGGGYGGGGGGGRGGRW
jgi:RNA recognition motif-containing protein